MYIADAGNNRIRKITASTGIITTIAGNSTIGDYSGDNGPATSATMNQPYGVAVDIAGNVYIADYGNNCIRMVTVSTGIISTIAGLINSDGYNGDNIQATSASLHGPCGVRADSSGNVYIADTLNQRVRKVTKSTGLITTIAGTVYYGSTGDGGDATSATLNYPEGIAVDTAGNVYIGDTYNNRVRLVYSYDVEAYSHSVLDCVSDHHHGYDINNDYILNTKDKCMECPPLSVSFLTVHYERECSVENFLDSTYDKCTLFNCVPDHGGNNYLTIHDSMLHGLVADNLQAALVLFLLGFFGFVALLSVRNPWLSLGIAAYIMLPFVDFMTDFAYIITQPFYSWVGLMSCFCLITVPWIHFAYYLSQMKAHPKMRFIEMPNSLFFRKYDTIFKVAYTGIGYLLFTILNGNILWFLLGGFLYAIKLFPITVVSNTWFFYWLGDNRLENNILTFDGAFFNNLLYSELLMESLPQFILQLVNAVCLYNINVQDFTAISVTSITVSTISLMHVLYRIVYTKLYLGQNLAFRPVDLTLDGLIPSNAIYKTFSDEDAKKVPFRATLIGLDVETNSKFTELTRGSSYRDRQMIDSLYNSLNNRVTQLEESMRMLTQQQDDQDNDLANDEPPPETISNPMQSASSEIIL